MIRVRALGVAAALAGVALLAAPPAWATDTSPGPTTTTSVPASASPAPTTTTVPPDGPPVAPPVAALPRTVAFTSGVSRRAAPPGTAITVSGTGCQRVHVFVMGQPTGWDDVPPGYFERTVSATNGAWHTAFRMPPLLGDVHAECLDAGSTAFWEQTVAPVDTPAFTGLIRTLGGDRLSLQLVLVDQPQPPVDLLTDQGIPVAYTVSPTGTLLFRRPAGALRVIVIGWHQFEENAGARNQGALLSFTAWLPTAATPTPAPSPSTKANGDGLAPSGGPGTLLPIALLLIAGGAALALRPRTNQVSTPTTT